MNDIKFERAPHGYNIVVLGQDDAAVHIGTIYTGPRSSWQIVIPQLSVNRLVPTLKMAKQAVLDRLNVKPDQMEVGRVYKLVTLPGDSGRRETIYGKFLGSGVAFGFQCARFEEYTKDGELRDTLRIVQHECIEFAMLQTMNVHYGWFEVDRGTGPNYNPARVEAK